MGLLNFDNLNENALLQAGLGILANNTGNGGQFAPAFGRGTMQGMQQASEYKRQREQDLLRQQQIAQQTQQFDMHKEKFLADKAQSDAQRAAMGNVSSQFGIDPQLLEAYPSLGESVIKSRLIPKEKKIGFTPSGVAYDENSPELKLGESYAKPEPVDYNKAFLPDGKPNSAFQNYELGKTKAGASVNNVSVNTGQKGFDNTLKLRGDFRSEPIYKAHQDVQSAHSQITASLRKASPAGDLAGATKLMKILDPGSVVRESELAMAMAASGKLDRLENYGSMVLSGNKLTPKQRVDFQQLADELSGESARLYNAKRDEYKGIASRNSLNELDVLGNPENIKPTTTTQGSVKKYNPKTGRIE